MCRAIPCSGPVSAWLTTTHKHKRHLRRDCPVVLCVIYDITISYVVLGFTNWNTKTRRILANRRLSLVALVLSHSTCIYCCIWFTWLKHTQTRRRYWRTCVKNCGFEKEGLLLRSSAYSSYSACYLHGMHWNVIYPLCICALYICTSVITSSTGQHMHICYSCVWIYSSIDVHWYVIYVYATPVT